MNQNQNTKLPSDFEKQQKLAIKRNRIWLITYVSLFTSLLAFFVLIITITELEGVSSKRSYHKIISGLYHQINIIQQRDGLIWMQVENTFSKGVRITIDPKLFETSPLFASAKAEINPRYFPYLNELARLIEELALPEVAKRHQRWVRLIEAAGFTIEVTLRIEGHTDANPLAPGARFRDNIELSTFRAYELMTYLQRLLQLDPAYYAIAGYGSFHPVTANPFDAENRRIELYILPQMVEPRIVERIE